jgi:hypothetical protein
MTEITKVSGPAIGGTCFGYVPQYRERGEKDWKNVPITWVN